MVLATVHRDREAIVIHDTGLHREILEHQPAGAVGGDRGQYRPLAVGHPSFDHGMARGIIRDSPLETNCRFTCRGGGSGQEIGDSTAHWPSAIRRSIMAWR